MGKEAKTINVYCKNGHLLFKNYRKEGSGRLQKCFVDMIGKDLTDSSSLKMNEIIYCTLCYPPIAVAVVGLVHGRPAYIINHSGTRKVIT